jgi:glycosyltransferase involved in cell wall biosynthesis
MMNGSVKISVVVFTYNQQDTIGQALDSVICQQGDFELEVVVGEDCSKDNTWNICNEYQKRYPNVVRLLPNEKNLGIMGNFARTAKACTGDYLAILAGDDYWCDEHKLQKQLHFMQEHPEYGVVCTNGYRLMVHTGKLMEGIAPLHPIPDGDVRGYYHDRFGGVYAMPLSLLIRRDLMQYVDLDAYIRLGFPVEDYPMQSVLAHHTRFGYLPDKTCVYRVHQESATFVSYDHPRYLAYHKGLADIRRYLHNLFPDDVPFTEEWAADYVFYKEFLLYLYHLEYRKACALLKRAPLCICQTQHYGKAKQAVKTRVHFVAMSFYKRIIHHRNIQKQTI